MNAEVDVEEVPKAKPKSKRLSSLICIAALWIFVRLIAELDHISWERSFSTDAVIFGLWPASLFFVLAFISFNPTYQTIFQWAAFFSIFGSFSFLFIFDRQSDAINFTVLAQRATVFLVCLGVLAYWIFTRKAKND